MEFDIIGVCKAVVANRCWV